MPITPQTNSQLVRTLLVTRARWQEVPSEENFAAFERASKLVPDHPMALIFVREEAARRREERRRDAETVARIAANAAKAREEQEAREWMAEEARREEARDRYYREVARKAEELKRDPQWASDTLRGRVDLAFGLVDIPEVAGRKVVSDRYPRESEFDRVLAILVEARS